MTCGKTFEIVSLLQSATFRTLQVVIPAAAAADVLALHTEWALNISVFTPAFVSSPFSYLAMVEEHTGLCGLVTPTNRVVWSPLSGLVHTLYSFSAITGHSSLS